jgi:hypothetical protein
MEVTEIILVKVSRLYQLSSHIKDFFLGYRFLIHGPSLWISLIFWTFSWGGGEGERVFVHLFHFRPYFQEIPRKKLLTKSKNAYRKYREAINKMEMEYQEVVVPHPVTEPENS